MAATALKFVPSGSFAPEDELIGSSNALRQVREAIHLVAPTDSTVLIQGETGTGKELVARAIHRQSFRHGAPFIKLNCAAIPAGLLETELFGHERGAFTGAVAQAIGRFQLAHTGTLFLDEIGDMPLELQPKLLRALQEQEFERIGGTRTIQVNVRVVAATNQDLAQMVRDRRFRMDLFYRLNVFPIPLPPLRDRSEDIPALVRHFARRFAFRMNKHFHEIPDEILKPLQRHYWQGNIRELQNLVERAVITSREPELGFPVQQAGPVVMNEERSATRTLAEAERDHICEVLRLAGGVVGGRHGAAAKLGVPRTTLLHRMRKLGIEYGSDPAAMYAAHDRLN